jgi:RimJ/RimL family protein N-acetyltransferase
MTTQSSPLSHNGVGVSQGPPVGTGELGPRHHTLIPFFDELADERILLRPYHEANVYMSVYGTRDLIVRWQARLLREDLAFGIWRRDTDRHLGRIAQHPRGWNIRAFEIGCWLAAAAKGHGYMAVAMRPLTDYACTHLAAHRVAIRCDSRNARSAASPRRLGFPQEDLIRQHMRAADGAIRDTLIFALTATDTRWPGSSGQPGQSPTSTTGALR